MIIDRAEALALAAFAAGVGLFVFYIIPRIEFAIAAFDHVTRGF
jgi:hypothetical protein